jgi:hypothetical protein
MAAGVPFLGQFDVPAPIPCAMMTGESGKATIKETLGRIANSKSIGSRELSDRLVISTRLPDMGDDDHLAAIERDIRRYGLKCLAIDPSYLSFGDIGDSASNVFKMGAALSRVTSIIQNTGCTVLLLNHATKGRGKDIGRFSPPELGEVAMSGFAEWARFWILLAAQREWDEDIGRHSLWMRLGGSAGHAGLWSVEVTEGRRSDPGGRGWNVKLSTAGEALREQKQEAANRKAEQQERTEQIHCDKVRQALSEATEGETKTNLAKSTKLNSTNVGKALGVLEQRGEIDVRKERRGGQECNVYRLVKPWSDKARQGPTN